MGARIEHWKRTTVLMAHQELDEANRGEVTVDKFNHPLISPTTNADKMDDACNIKQE